MSWNCGTKTNRHSHESMSGTLTLNVVVSLHPLLAEKILFAKSPIMNVEHASINHIVKHRATHHSFRPKCTQYPSFGTQLLAPGCLSHITSSSLWTARPCSSTHPQQQQRRPPPTAYSPPSTPSLPAATTPFPCPRTRPSVPVGCTRRGCI